MFVDDLQQVVVLIMFWREPKRCQNTWRGGGASMDCQHSRTNRQYSTYSEICFISSSLPDLQWWPIRKGFLISGSIELQLLYLWSGNVAWVVVMWQDKTGISQWSGNVAWVVVMWKDKTGISQWSGNVAWVVVMWKDKTGVTLLYKHK